eukprot:jgi/Ulvmu1/11051/UM007_0233.1
MKKTWTYAWQSCRAPELQCTAVSQMAELLLSPSQFYVVRKATRLTAGPAQLLVGAQVVRGWLATLPARRVVYKLNHWLAGIKKTDSIALVVTGSGLSADAIVSNHVECDSAADADAAAEVYVTCGECAQHWTEFSWACAQVGICSPACQCLEHLQTVVVNHVSPKAAVPILISL